MQWWRYAPRPTWVTRWMPNAKNVAQQTRLKEALERKDHEFDDVFDLHNLSTPTPRGTRNVLQGHEKNETKTD